MSSSKIIDHVWKYIIAKVMMTVKVKIHPIAIMGLIAAWCRCGNARYR